MQRPAFEGEKCYERWKEEIAAWELICGIEKKKQTLLIALSFPEGRKVEDKMFKEVKNEDFNKDNGMKLLLEHLDKRYKEMKSQQPMKHGQDMITNKEEEMDK